MRIQVRFAVALCLAAGIFSAGSALADDLMPPPWRGQPLTTLTEWEFLQGGNPTPPDGTIVPVVGDGGGGGPLATILGPMQWDLFDGDGAWIGNGTPTTPDGQILLDIPNWIDEEPVKWIQIQMTVQRYERVNTDGTTELITPHVSAVDAFDPTGPTTSMLVEVMPEKVVSLLDGTYLRTELWKIFPNPDYERITINVPVDTLVDQIVVDTISTVPEPSTWILVAVGFAGLWGAMRRRKR